MAGRISVDILVDQFGAEYVGVDIAEYDTWAESRSDVTLVRRDISADPSDDLGEFDVIISLAVLEHVVHPHAMLNGHVRPTSAGRRRVSVDANLYRGPKASHRYRQVYFPWPHLLFGDDVWREFYRKVHDRDETFSWVNKLTYAQYLMYFDTLGFRQRKVWLTESTFDAPFYERFEDVLSRYPRFDLSHDFVHAVLERPRNATRSATGHRARGRRSSASIRSWPRSSAPSRGDSPHLCGSFGRRLGRR